MASLDFPESQLVAEIYAQALEAAGFPVRRELALGSRELVQPALRQGMVDVVPEYLGSALASLSADQQTPPGVDAQDPGAVRAALVRALSSWGVEVLGASPAQDRNVVVVTAARARREGLRSVSDLVRRGPVSLAVPPECAARPYCLPGLEGVYGMRVSSLMTFASESQRASALDEGVVDAAVMFTTDGRLAAGAFMALRDDRQLQPAENVTPLVREATVSRYGPGVVTALNRVSVRMTSRALQVMNWRVDVAGKPVADEARGWLQRQALIAG